MIPGPRGGSAAVVLVHGFAGNRHKPAIARLADALAGHVGVVSVDLRGHGGSSGASTFGDREARDVAAAVAWARSYGYTEVVALGVSMGAMATLRAVADGATVDAVIGVSMPARFRPPEPSALVARLARLHRSGLRRRLLRVVTGLRVAPAAASPTARLGPADPVDLVTSLPCPLLLVHGVDDHVVPIGDARLVARRAARSPAGDRVVLWERPAGFGHAEDGLTPETLTALTEAVRAVLLRRRFPARPTEGRDPGT